MAKKGLRLTELVVDVIPYRVTVFVCSRSGIHQNDSAVETFDERAVALAHRNEVQNQLGLRLAPGCRSTDEGKHR
ncbi:MAG: hypothetical protein V3T53_03735 [Phycisphaerales bacterium]